MTKVSNSPFKHKDNDITAHPTGLRSYSIKEYHEANPETATSVIKAKKKKEKELLKKKKKWDDRKNNPKEYFKKIGIVTNTKENPYLGTPKVEFAKEGNFYKNETTKQLYRFIGGKYVEEKPEVKVLSKAASNNAALEPFLLKTANGGKGYTTSQLETIDKRLRNVETEAKNRIKFEEEAKTLQQTTYEDIHGSLPPEVIEAGPGELGTWDVDGNYIPKVTHIPELKKAKNQIELIDKIMGGTQTYTDQVLVDLQIPKLKNKTVLDVQSYGSDDYNRSGTVSPKYIAGHFKMDEDDVKHFDYVVDTGIEGGIARLERDASVEEHFEEYMEITAKDKDSYLYDQFGNRISGVYTPKETEDQLLEVFQSLYDNPNYSHEDIDTKHDNISYDLVRRYQLKEEGASDELLKGQDLTFNRKRDKNLFNWIKKELKKKGVNSLSELSSDEINEIFAGKYNEITNKAFSDWVNKIGGSEYEILIEGGGEYVNRYTSAELAGIDDKYPSIERLSITKDQKITVEDIGINVTDAKWYVSSGERDFVENLKVPLKEAGYIISDKTDNKSDKAFIDVIMIKKIDGGKETELTITLPTAWNKGKKQGIERWEEVATQINNHMAKHKTNNVALVGEELKRKEIRVELTTEIFKTLIGVEGGESAEPLTYEQKKDQAAIQEILKEKLVKKMTRSIAELNDINYTLEDEKLSMKEFTQKYHEDIDIGYDYTRLLNQANGWWRDSAKEDVFEYYKNKTGQGKNIFGRDAYWDAWIFGISSWETEGKYKLLDEIQIENIIKDAIGMYADHQMQIVLGIKEDKTEKLKLHAKINTDIIVDDYLFDKYEMYEKGDPRRDVFKKSHEYLTLFKANEENPSEENIQRLITLDKEIKEARKKVDPDQKTYIFTDHNGNQVMEDDYDARTGEVLDPLQQDFYRELITQGLQEQEENPNESADAIIANIETEDLLNISNIDELPPKQIATIKKLSLLQGKLVEDKWADDQMRMITGDYIINDRLAWAVLEKLSKDPRFKDRIKLVSKGADKNEYGRVYNLDAGILEEFYDQIIGEDGAEFLGNPTETIAIERSEYSTPFGFFSPVEGEWAWDTDKDGIGAYIAPRIIGGGEGQTTGFTNYLKDNRDVYIERANQLIVINQMLMERTDPISLSDDSGEKFVDFFDHTGEVWKKAWGSGDENVFQDEDNLGNYDGNGNYQGREMSERTRKDIMQTVLTAANMDVSVEQREAFRRGVGMSAWEGTVTFVPLICEFAATEVGLVALEAVTFGGATPIVAAAQASAIGRWSAKLVSMASKGKKAGNIFTPFASIGKALPGATGRGAFYETYLASSKVYKGANGIRLSEKQLLRLEKVTGKTRGTTAFTKAISVGPKAKKIKGKRRPWSGGKTLEREYLPTVLHHAYRGLREEAKMALTFREHYHPGGGLAFYGVGKVISKAGLRFSETSLIGSKAAKGSARLKTTRIGKIKHKLGLSGALTLENYSNILNSGLGLGRSGVAGMISVPLSQAFEKFLVDLGGGETFDFVEDLYPEINMHSALTNFFTYSMLGIKGVYGPKGTGLKTVRQLEKLEKLTAHQTRRAFEEGFDVAKKAWTSKKLEAKHNKYAELSSAVKSKLNILRNTTKWMDPKWAEKQTRKVMDRLKENFKDLKGKELNVVYVNTAEKLRKNKGRNDKILGGAPAGIKYNPKTEKFDIIIDVSRTEGGKIPHEIQHFLDRAVVEMDPLAASRLVEVTLEAMGKHVITNQVVVDAKGEPILRNGKIQFKDYTIEEFVKEKYGDKGGHEQNLEILGYIAETLSKTKYFHKFTRGGKENSWNKMSKSIREWQREQHNPDGSTKTFDIALMPKVLKRQVINFLAEMAQAGKNGKTNAGFIKKYKELAESLVFDQPNGFQGVPWQGQTNMKSLNLHEQRMELQEILDKHLKASDFVESVKGLNEEAKAKKRELYQSDVKEIKDKIAEITKEIAESEKDFQFEKDVQEIYGGTKDKNDAAWKIANEYDPRQGQSAGAGRINTELKKYEKLPNFEYEKGNILNDLLTDSNRSIRQMVLDYDPSMKNSKGEKIPLSGYIGSILKKRGLSESVQKFIPEGAKFSVEFEGKFVETMYTEDAVVEYDVAPESVEGIRLVEALKIKPQTIKQIESKIKDLDLNNISFAKLKDLAPELTKEMFGKGPKGKAEYIAENWKTIYDLLPEGAMLKSGKVEIEGLSTQVNPAVLAALYKPSSRKVTEGAQASAAETGKTAGLKVQEKIQGLNKKQFLEKLGIKTIALDGIIKGKESVEIIYPKGTKEYRNTTETLFKGIITETGRMVTNQVVREAIKKGELSERLQTEYSVEQFDRILKAGKSDIMLSLNIERKKWEEEQRKLGFDTKEIKNEIVTNSLDLSPEKAQKFITDSTRLMLDIFKNGVDKVYDPKTLRLLPKYKGIFKYTSDFVLKELFSKGLILDQQTMGKGLGKLLMKGVKSGQRGQVLEQHHIDLAVRLSKEYPGLKVKTIKVTEGGIPDLHLELHGIAWNVEIKMANAQHSSVTPHVNFNTGEFTLSKKNKYIEELMPGLIAKAAPGWKAYEKEANRLAEKHGYEWRFSLEKGINHKDNWVPPEVWTGLEKGNFRADTRVVDPDCPIEAVYELYANKEYPTYDINTQGKGLHWMGKKTFPDLDYPQLVADAIATMRSVPTTVDSKAKKGWKRLGVRVIPTVISNTVKRSNVSLGNELQFREFLENPAIKALEVANRELHKPVKEGRIELAEKISGIKQPKNISKERAEEIIEITEEATRKARKKKKKPIGMSAWDFDGTLVSTKSGVRYTSPNPSGKPAPKKKVIFMAGGPGSGKSSIIKGLNLKKQGFKIVNQDISLEWLMKNHGLPKDMRDFTPEQASKFGSLGWDARMIAKRKQTKFQGKGDGIIVDGTGNSLSVMKNQVQEFKNKGYDVQMVFVETSKDIAIERNRVRKERSLKTSIVERTWDNVMKNKEAFKELFGNRFAEVNTDRLKQKDPMPTDVVVKMDAFTKGYKKGRLSAEEFANEGERILEEGGEFDFVEFDYVKEGTEGPLFGKAMERAKKFGFKDQFVITARPHAAKMAIFRFLDAKGLKIPFENIITLENSSAEAKATWMLEKFSEGYNDMYFADDAMQNVKAVKDVLGKLDVKSKVVQAKSTNDIKDVNRLDSPGNYENIMLSKNHREEYERTIAKHRPDLVKEGLVSKTVDNMFTFVDNLNIAESKKRKYEQITTKWLATSNVKLVEDRYKITDAINLAEKYKEDVFSYKNPNELIEKYAGKVKEKFVNPNNVKEFSPSGDYKQRGLTTYNVENTREGQQAVRDIIDSHWGENSNPWCLTQAKNGKLTEDSWQNWTVYEKGPKRIIFQDGKLSSFYANRQYWDRMDNATDGPPIVIKEGRVTKKVELVETSEGSGKFEEFVMETRTISKDKKTATTEYFHDKPLDPEGYAIHPEGTKVVENKVNGITVKEKIYRANGKIRRITDFKNGKEIETRTIGNDGKTNSINNGRELNWEKQGDLVALEIIDGNTNVWFGKALINGKITEIGFKTPRDFEVMDVMKRVDGKLRVDAQKLLKIDPDVKGLPKDLVAETGMKTMEPVKKVLDQLDIKSEVQQTIMKSLDINKEFNKILEGSTGTKSEKEFKAVTAKMMGEKSGRRKLITSSAEDFELLTAYTFAGKGKKGEADMKFFEDNLFRPFARGINEINRAKQAVTEDYLVLRKSMPKVKRLLGKTVPGTKFTHDAAIRVHRWTKAGYEIPGLSKTDLKILNEVVEKNQELLIYSEKLGEISKQKKGWTKPTEYWLAENITADLANINNKVNRTKYLEQWIENKNIIFSETNLNKIEALYGTKHRSAIEDMLYRMETGRNRTKGLNALTNKFMNWTNASVGAIMFFNMRSAGLQLLSSVNFLNWKENNPAKAALAFANQPRYWKDFAKLFNSDMLKQRRAGLQMNVNEAEIAAAVENSSNKPLAALNWLLKKGFLPTQIADSFAIASGGATFYRNRIKMYEKQGLSSKAAEKKAFTDFQEIAEKTQQSARPDLISQQQASPLGRLILAFANTPMQYARIIKKARLDIANGRGDMKSNVSRIIYYGAIQSMIFASLQAGVFSMLFDDELDEDFIDNKTERVANTMLDGSLRGLGVGGAVISALKNGIMSFMEENNKDWNADYDNVWIDLLNVSPPIGSKIRKLKSASQSYQYNKEIIPKMGLDIENPGVYAVSKVISALTNVPLDRLVTKINNIKGALDVENETWQRIAQFMGYNRWDLGMGKTETVEKVKAEVKIEKEIESEKKLIIKKQIKKKEKEKEEENLIKENIKKQDQEKKDGQKDIKCAAISKSGNRCKTTIEPGQSYCTIHEEVKESKSGEKVQCKYMKKISKKKRKQCGMMTNSESGLCYYHD